MKRSCGLAGRLLALLGLVAQAALPWAHESRVALQEAGHHERSWTGQDAGQARSAPDRHDHHDAHDCGVCPKLSRMREALAGARTPAPDPLSPSLRPAPAERPGFVPPDLAARSPRGPPSA